MKCGKDLALTGISGILYVILQNFLALRMRLENNFIGQFRGHNTSSGDTILINLSLLDHAAGVGLRARTSS